MFYNIQPNKRVTSFLTVALFFVKKMKKFLQTQTGRHIYSFAKTFVVAFLAIGLFADSQGQDIFELAFIVGALKASSIVVFRNIYKILTEK